MKWYSQYALVLATLFICQTGAVTIPSDQAEKARRDLALQPRAKTSTATTTVTYLVPYTVTKSGQPVTRTRSQTITVTANSIASKANVKVNAASYSTYTTTYRTLITTTVIKNQTPTVRTTSVKVTTTKQRTISPSATATTSSSSSTSSSSTTSSTSISSSSSTTSSSSSSSTTTSSSSSSSTSSTTLSSTTPASSSSSSDSQTPTGSSASSSATDVAPTNTASATTAAAVACPTARQNIGNSTSICATDPGNGTSVTTKSRAQVILGQRSFLATGALTNSIVLSGSTTEVTAIYANGSSYLAGGFDHTFGNASIMLWQSTGWFAQGGCDQSIEPYLITQCFYMGSSGNNTLNLEPGLPSSLARQRIELYTPGTTNRAYHYTWKSFLNTTSTTYQFFHLFQILSRGTVTGPIVTLDAVGGNAVIKDFIRCPDGCGSISLADFAERVIVNDIVVRYGWSGSITYTASDFLTGNVLLTYNVTNGYMGDESVSLKFGQYRGVTGNVSDVSSFVGDFTSQRIPY